MNIDSVRLPLSQDSAVAKEFHRAFEDGSIVNIVVNGVAFQAYVVSRSDETDPWEEDRYTTFDMRLLAPPRFLSISDLFSCVTSCKTRRG